ncbi:hypothetical protein I7093_003083 [Vibrio parahaemolyticus]|nr:hypothetical protein [Vibrio parahaemolyticus]
MFMAQCFRFGWRRCSPLNWALGIFNHMLQITLFIFDFMLLYLSYGIFHMNNC